MYEVRPLTSFAIKSIGDTLRPFFSGSKILDLFAGLGTFSEIALKNGAEFAVAIENNRSTYLQLKSNFAKETKMSPLREDVFSYLANTREVYDIIFADPPYPLWDDKFQKMFLPLISGQLEKDGIFLVRHPKKVVLLEEFLKLPSWKTKTIGESQVSYFKYGE